MGLVHQRKHTFESQTHGAKVHDGINPSLKNTPPPLLLSAPPPPPTPPPPFFPPPPPPPPPLLNLETVQAPKPPPLFRQIYFGDPPHALPKNWVFSDSSPPAPIILNFFILDPISSFKSN